jgi:ornithine decarboxylase
LFRYAEKKWNHKLTLLDIGGGWVGDDDNFFSQQAATVMSGLKEYFSKDVKVIAEPGRFFSASTTSIAMKILGKRSLKEKKTTSFQYFLADGIYGMLSYAIYVGQDAAKLLQEGFDFKPLFPVKNPKRFFATRLWGPTCDSGDYIVDNIQLPELDTENFLYTDNGGAYTYSAKTRFNQITPSKTYYVFLAK